jgi:hypothetical protein
VSASKLKPDDSVAIVRGAKQCGRFHRGDEADAKIRGAYSGPQVEVGQEILITLETNRRAFRAKITAVWEDPGWLSVRKIG